MPRKKTPEGKTAAWTIKLGEADAARCDAARGEMPRSEWGRAALLAAAGEPVAVPGIPQVQVFPAGLMPGEEVVRPKRTKDKGDCPHPKARVHGGLCGACGTGGLSGG